MIKRIFASLSCFFFMLLTPTLAFAAGAGQAADQGETVAQIGYWTGIGIAIRDFIFIVMFIAGIVIFFIAVIILVKDFVMADAQRGDKKFSIGELGLGILLAGALVSPYGLLQVGADAAGGSQGQAEINAELFNEARDNQQDGGQ